MRRFIPQSSKKSNILLLSFGSFIVLLCVSKNIRQHALSILTDLFLKKHQSQQQQSSTTGSASVSNTIGIPTDQLCLVLSEICIPLAGRRIVQLQNYSNSSKDVSITSIDQLMMEFELCIGLIFKPLRQHLPSIIVTTDTTVAAPNGYLTLVWSAVLSVLEHLFSPSHTASVEHDPTADEYNTNHHHNPPIHSAVLSDELIATMNSLAKEHLQSAIQVLVSLGVLSFPTSEPSNEASLTTQTWKSVRKMGITDKEIQQWT